MYVWGIMLVHLFAELFFHLVVSFHFDKYSGYTSALMYKKLREKKLSSFVYFISSLDLFPLLCRSFQLQAVLFANCYYYFFIYLTSIQKFIDYAPLKVVSLRFFQCILSFQKTLCLSLYIFWTDGCTRLELKI